MQKQTRNELIVGLVFFAGMSFLGVYTIIISGLFKGPTKTYLVNFPKIYGLKKGDQVRVEGLDVGEVTELRLIGKPNGDERINARLRVAKDVEIYKEQSEVKVTPFSPLGGRIIEIKRGVATDDRASPGSTQGAYLSEEQCKDDAEKKANTISGTAEGELLQTLTQLVDENRPGIKKIVKNLETVSQHLTETDNVIGALINDTGTGSLLKDAAGDLADTARNLNKIVARIEAGKGIAGELVVEQSDLHENVNAAAKSARSALDSADQILANANQGKSALGVFVSADNPEVTADMKSIVHDVSVVTSDVAAGKGTLGMLVKDSRLYEGATATAENLGKITSNITKNESAAGVLLNDPETGAKLRSTVSHVESIAGSVDQGNGALGMLIKDNEFRDRVARIFTEVERLTVEFRDSVEDLREQAPINAFLGAVFAAF
jgi:ABC-type transporter Mla subunit MlaD